LPSRLPLAHRSASGASARSASSILTKECIEASRARWPKRRIFICAYLFFEFRHLSLRSRNPNRSAPYILDLPRNQSRGRLGTARRLRVGLWETGQPGVRLALSRSAGYFPGYRGAVWYLERRQKDFFCHAASGGTTRRSFIAARKRQTLGPFRRALALHQSGLVRTAAIISRAIHGQRPWQNR